jgi:hypothetical protein
MKKFRIVKQETTNGLGEVVKTSYIIQKRFLFWWFDCNIPNAHILKYSGVCYINNNVKHFSSKEIAQQYIHDYLLFEFKYSYKNHRVIKVMDNDYYVETLKLKPMYVDVSDVIKNVDYDTCHQYSYSLDKIKQIIDNKVLKTKTTIV